MQLAVILLLLNNFLINEKKILHCKHNINTSVINTTGSSPITFLQAHKDLYKFIVSGRLTLEILLPLVSDLSETAINAACCFESQRLIL